ncbi:MAG: hypothetical protein HY791_09210 [Deltaproteobacteria bacterium]|nr:hypothetical protein [Deltaproteobacteria bacterium]
MSPALGLLCLLGEPMLAFVAADGEARDGAWVATRLADLASQDARRLGLPTVDEVALRVDPTIQAEVTTARIRVVKRAKSQLEASVEVLGQKVELAGGLEDLDELGVAIAVSVGELAGWSFDPDQVAATKSHRDPSDLHQMSTAAATDLREGRTREAALAFDRINAMHAPAFDAEAFLRGMRARLSASEGAGLDAELAASSLERARRSKSLPERLSALASALRYVPRRVLRWSISMPLPPDVRIMVGDDFTAIARPGRDVLLVDSRSGVVLDKVTAEGSAIAALGSRETRQVLGLEGIRVTRLARGRAPAFSTMLPFAPAAWSRPIRGLMAFTGPPGLVWLDLSIGSISKIVESYSLLASGTDAVVVEAPDGLGLLRAGQRAVAWKVPMPKATRQVAVSFDRIVLLGPEGITTIDALDGRTRAKLPTCPNAKLLATEGRYGVLATCDAVMEVVDVLGGERVARFVAPAPGIGADAASEGVVVLYESSDVLGYDRNGQLIERVWLGGLGISVSNDPMRGSVVATTRGVFALGDLTSRATSDAELLGELAAALIDAKELDEAARTISFGRSILKGGVAMFSELEAKVHKARGHVAESERAERRALEARDKARALVPYPNPDRREDSRGPAR